VQDVFAVLNVQFPPAAQPPFSDRPGCETGAYVLVPFLNVSAITLSQFYSTTAGIEVVLDTNSGDGILYATDPTAALGVNGNVTTLVFEFDNDIVGVLYGIQVRQYIDNLFVTRIVDGNELPSTALFLRQNVPEIICPLPGDTTVCPTTLSTCGPVANCDQIGDVTACGDENSCFIDAQENCAQCPTCPVCPDTCTTSPDCAFLNEMDCRTTEECQYSSTTSECTLCSACPPFSCTCPDPVEVSVNYSPDSFEVNVTTQRNAVGTCATENTIFFVVDFEDKLCDDNRYLNRSTQSLGFISQAQEPGCRFVYEWDDNDRELIVLFRFNYSLDATDESDVSIVLNSTFGAMPDCGTLNETFDSGVCALPTVDTLQIGPQIDPSVFAIVSFLLYETYSNSCSALSQQYLFNLLDLPGFMVSTPFFDNTSRANIAVTSTLPNYAGDITVNGAPVVFALFVDVEMPGTVITTLTHGIVGTDFVVPQTVTDVRAFAYPSTCVPDTFALSLFDTVSNTSGNTAIVDIAVTRNLDIGCGTGLDNEIAFTFETFAEPAEFVAEADPVALTDFAPVESYTFTTSSTQGALLRETDVSTSLRFRHLGTSVFRIESTVTTLSMAYQVRVGGTIQDTLSVVFTSSETEAQLLAEQARPANPLNNYAAILCGTTYTCALGTTRALCEQRSDVCGTEQTNCCAYFYP